MSSSSRAGAPGWPRASAAVAGTLLLLVLAFFYVPHWILTALHAPARGVRVWMATAWVAAAFVVACAAALRSTRAAPHGRAR